MILRSVFVFLFAVAAAFSQARTVTDAEVMRVHKSVLLIDTHNDVTTKTVAGFDIGQRATTGDTDISRGHTDIPRMREGGLGAQFFAVYVAASYVEGNHSANRALQMVDTVQHDIVGRYPDTFQLCYTADDIEAAHKRGKIAALMGIEGGHAIEDSLRLLRDFYLLGIRYITLTHGNTNNWADAAGDANSPGVKHHDGLTNFGKDVVREMNRLGIMVDVSHVADKTFWDALEVSSAPVFASHSSCRALSNVPRNMTDEMIQALAKKGGVIQICFSCDFLSQKAADAAAQNNQALQEKIRQQTEGRSLTPEERRELMRKLREEVGIKPVRATLDDVVAHIDHVVKIAGVDYVGIGGDFDGVGCVPEGLDDVSKFPNLTRALLEKGYTASDIRKIYGGNLLRVMRVVEKAAAQSGGSR